MKINVRKSTLIFLNVVLIAPFIFFFTQGIRVAVCMIPVWFVMTIINSVFSKNAKEVRFYNKILSLVASIGILICALLYFKFVCFDVEGTFAVGWTIFLEVAYITMLTEAEAGFKNKKQK